jgi:hypothetical protein
MRRIVVPLALLAAAACGESPAGPAPGETRTQIFGSGTLRAPAAPSLTNTYLYTGNRSDADADDGAATGGSESTAAAPFIGSGAREGETASAAGQIVGSGG